VAPVIQLHRLVQALAPISGLLILSVAGPCQEWSTYKPSLRSQVSPLGHVEAGRLLGEVCESITEAAEFGITCKTRPMGPAFANIIDNRFCPKGVIFGHFLDSAVESAAVSGWSVETHPYHWGGTLLLTRDRGKWKPNWYKAGLITRSCERAERPDGRDILLCEFEDEGMGHRYHEINAIDFRNPSSATAPLVSADSFESDFCVAQQQTLGAIQWEPDRRTFSVLLRTPAWERLPDGNCGSHPPKRPPPSVRMAFEITSDGVHLR
jgi:hypothetical protein